MLYIKFHELTGFPLFHCFHGNDAAKLRFRFSIARGRFENIDLSTLPHAMIYNENLGNIYLPAYMMYYARSTPADMLLVKRRTSSLL